MYKLVLLGRDIGYTESPNIHKAIAAAIGVEIEFDVADVTYDMLEQTVSDLLDNYDGFFVTKPYKTDVLRYLPNSGFDGRSVNVVRSRDGAAFNTDGSGFIHAIDGNFGGWRDRTNAVLVLGAGGAAHAVSKALIETGKHVYVLDRTLKHALELCAACGAELYVNQPAEMIVNCTSVGLNGEDALRALCVLPSFEYAYDLIYTAEVTPFLRRCRDYGSAIANGTDMLIYQAIEGDRILLGKQFDVEDVFGAVKNLLEKRRR